MLNAVARSQGISGTHSSGPVSDVVVERQIRGHKIACREWGKPGNPVLIGIHGLASNSLCFADIAQAVAAGYHVIVPDLRGRNLSPPSGSFSYGWPSHAKDIVAIADAVGAKTFSAIGHSMGAYVAQELPVLAPGRVERMVILDALGIAEIGAVQSISSSINRLGKTYASTDAYVETIKSKGIIKPFTKTWDRHYREEVVRVRDGVTPRTDRAAVDEDTYYATSRATNPSSFPAAWRLLPEQTLVVRAGQPLAPVLGRFISDADVFAYKALRGDKLFKTVDANHYTVLTEPNTVALIAKFFRGEPV